MKTWAVGEGKVFEKERRDAARMSKQNEKQVKHAYKEHPDILMLAVAIIHAWNFFLYPMGENR